MSKMRSQLSSRSAGELDFGFEVCQLVPQNPIAQVVQRARHGLTKITEKMYEHHLTQPDFVERILCSSFAITRLEISRRV